jgi:hypothetical protein
MPRFVQAWSYRISLDSPLQIQRVGSILQPSIHDAAPYDFTVSSKRKG